MILVNACVCGECTQKEMLNNIPKRQLKSMRQVKVIKTKLCDYEIKLTQTAVAIYYFY